MKIGVHCFPLKADIGGMKQYFHTLFGELLARDRANEYVFFYQEKNAEELARLPERWRENAVRLDKPRELKRHLRGLDLYFSPFIVLKPRPLPLPTVVMVPDNQEVFFPDFFPPEKHYNRAWHFRGSARMADRVLTLSEFSKNALAEHYALPREKISVAHLCAAPCFFEAEALARRPEVPLPGRPFLFYPANRWRHKNHDGLLRALRLLADKGRAVDLVLTGHDVPNGYPARQKAGEYGVGGRVYSVGYVDEAELAWLYRNAAMTVFPSLFEGFGLPLVEAMAAGCPVAASNAGSIPEVGGDAVESFDPRDPAAIAGAVERLLDDPSLRAERVERGRQRARDFSPQRLAEIHLRAFAEAREAYRPWRYAWNALAYGPWHAWSTARKYPGLKAR
ncbi:MAG: glycosyltransferase family 1 protein [Chthoniobacteraceae bacterium]|nr:glycosyltransferase family 1 protein [Chthoniobacteraceae bacterium]